MQKNLCRLFGNMGVGLVSTEKLVLEAFGVLGFQLGTSSMNSKLTGEGDEDADVLKKWPKNDKKSGVTPQRAPPTPRPIGDGDPVVDTHINVVHTKFF